MYLLAIGTGVLRLLAFYVISCFLLFPFESCLFQTFGYLLVFSAGLYDIGHQILATQTGAQLGFPDFNIPRSGRVRVFGIEAGCGGCRSLLDSIYFSCFFFFSFLLLLLLYRMSVLRLSVLGVS